MNRRIVPILAFMSIMFFSYVPGYMVANAQDSTPQPVTTEVVSVPSTPEPVATAVETAIPPTNPRGDLQLSDFLPYIVPIVLILAVMFLAIFGTTAVLLYKSAPPAVQAISVSVINTLLTQLRTYTDSTPDKLDDQIEAMIDGKVRELLGQVTGSANSVAPVASSVN